MGGPGSTRPPLALERVYFLLAIPFFDALVVAHMALRFSVGESMAMEHPGWMTRITAEWARRYTE